MLLSRTVLALALFFGLTTFVGAAPRKGTKAIPATKPHPHHHIHGIVVSTHHNAATGSREIKVRVHHHHKKRARTAAAAATSKKAHHAGIVTVHIHKSTKFSKAIHSQGRVHHEAAHFAEVHKGNHVHVTLSAKHHHASHVTIEVHHHGKKALPLTTRKLPSKKKKPK